MARKCYITTPQSDFLTLNSFEKLADRVVYVANGNKFGTSLKAISGDPLGDIPALKGGSAASLHYGGVPNLSIIGSPPIYSKYSDKETFVTFQNFPNQNYDSPEFSPHINNPREFAEIIRYLPGQNSEQFQDAFSTGNGFGDAGTYSDMFEGIMQQLGCFVRIHNQQVVEGAIIPFYKKCLVRICTEDNRVRLWINGVLKGQVTPEFAIPKSRDGIAVGTNNADHQAFVTYYYNRVLTDLERTNSDTSIMAKHGIDGSFPNFPYAYNIKQAKTSNVWGVTFLTRNTRGTGINSSLTQYRWIVNVRKAGRGFADQKVFATTSTQTNTQVLAAIEAYRMEIGAASFDEAVIYCQVKVFDNNGFSWEWMRGDYSYPLA